MSVCDRSASQEEEASRFGKAVFASPRHRPSDALGFPA